MVKEDYNFTVTPSSCGLVPLSHINKIKINRILTVFGVLRVTDKYETEQDKKLHVEKSSDV